MFAKHSLLGIVSFVCGILVLTTLVVRWNNHPPRKFLDVEHHGRRLSFQFVRHKNASLLEDSLQFLSSLTHRIEKSVDSHTGSGISFLSPEEVNAHKPVENIRRARSPERSKIASSSSEAVVFLNEEETKKHKPTAKKTADVSSEPSLQEQESYPAISGTLITPENILAVLKCPNQSKCISPELQMHVKTKVYFCRHPTRHGVRFYYLTREGLLLHPNVELINENSIENADYIIYLPGSAPWHLTECNKTEYASKLVVLDEFDGPTPLFLPAKNMDEYALKYGSKSARWNFAYFKRSFVRRRDGVFTNFPHLSQPDVFPLTYSIAEAYISRRFNFHREIEILCTLRGHSKMPTRLRVQQWVAAYAKDRNISNTISEQVSSSPQ